MLMKAKGKTEHHMHLQESFKIKLIAKTVSWMYKKIIDWKTIDD